MRRSSLALLVFVTSTAHASDELRPDERSGRVVAGKGGTHGAFDNALRLARMLGDDQTVAKLLSAQAQAPNAPLEDVREAMAALENVGKPAEAERLLRARMARKPKERESAVLLAELLERDAQSSAAAEVWRALDSANPFLLTPGQVVEYARDLARIGREEDAFAVLKAHADGVSADETELWHDLATLAWSLDDDATALMAYEKVWNKEPHRVNVASRLMNLAHDAGQIDLAVRVALADYADTHEPATLLFAADLEVQRSQWTAAKRILALAEQDPARFSKRAEYWLLRGEVYTELGDGKTATSAYRVAIGLRPASADAQAAVLWYDIQSGTLSQLARDLDQWRVSAQGSEALWKPFAAGLDRLGRTREAIEFYTRDLRAHPDDDTAALDLADALERTGNASMSERIRRHAMARRQAAALEILHRRDAPSDDVSKLAAHVEAVRKRAGAAMGERWLEAALHEHPRRPEVLDVALDTYMAEGRSGEARRMLWRQLPGHKVAEHKLALAIEAQDFGAVRRALAYPNPDISAAAKADAADLLEDDERESEYLRLALTEPAPGDRSALEQRLREIELRHRPGFKVGTTYNYINGLDVIGPEVGASHDLGPLRVLYAGYARAMAAESLAALVLPSPRLEADLSATFRATSARWATEGTAAFDYQPDRPLPRAAFTDEHLFGKYLSTRVDAAFDEAITDTGFLRIDGVRDRLTVEGRLDVGRFYASAYVEALDDHTRRFNHLSFGLEETAEAGVKVVRGEPEWDIGVQAIAVQRENVTSLPSDVAKDIPYAVPNPPPPDLDPYIPPSYEELLVVTHLVRGDFAERFTRDRMAFPRYDCEAGAGVLLAVTGPSAAVHVQCSVSFRLGGTGYLSAMGYYDLGVAGLENEQNALAGLYFTQPL